MLDIKSLYEAMPPELQRKASIHTLRLTVEKYNATPDPLREAARYAMQRMETIRETNPDHHRRKQVPSSTSPLPFLVADGD